ncbi:MAG: dTMP kinase [Candidatus Omnitrophica bacterium]|nr:dTMP kinase [Candidatus Omnitrophota bacterium]
MVNVECEEFKGKLIAVEGIDGSGKSTQIYLVKRWLELAGLKVFFTEWNSSLLVKKATKKAKKRNLLTPTTFSLIHCTDFTDRYERQILPLLEAGFIVLCDRYIYTAFARDATRGCDRRWLRNLYAFAVKPDITFFFHAPLDVAGGRILAGRPQLKYHEAGMDLNLSDDPYKSFALFQEMIHQEYVKMIDEFGFDVIDATQSIPDMQEKVRDVICERIDLASPCWRLHQ